MVLITELDAFAKVCYFRRSHLTCHCMRNRTKRNEEKRRLLKKEKVRDFVRNWRGCMVIQTDRIQTLKEMTLNPRHWLLV